MLTVTQVAERLQVSRSIVYALIDARKLSCHRIGLGRGTIRISESDLDAYLKNHVEPPPAPQPAPSRRLPEDGIPEHRRHQVVHSSRIDHETVQGYMKLVFLGIGGLILLSGMVSCVNGCAGVH